MEIVSPSVRSCQKITMPLSAVQDAGIWIFDVIMKKWVKDSSAEEKSITDMVVDAAMRCGLVKREARETNSGLVGYGLPTTQ